MVLIMMCMALQASAQERGNKTMDTIRGHHAVIIVKTNRKPAKTVVKITKLNISDSTLVTYDLDPATYVLAKGFYDTLYSSLCGDTVIDWCTHNFFCNGVIPAPNHLSLVALQAGRKVRAKWMIRESRSVRYVYIDRVLLPARHWIHPDGDVHHIAIRASDCRFLKPCFCENAEQIVVPLY